LRPLKSNNKADTVQVLIQQRADVTARDDTHSTPLHMASSKWSAEAVNLLIQNGADVNAQNGNQSTSLHLAASSHLALEGTIVRLLLRHGANVNAKESEGLTPLDIAILEGNFWIAKLLSENLVSRG
jgi:ankyrin repeat protein